MNVIETEGLVRRFGELTAVDHVSFEVGEQEAFGFLGPNGAGKTTTINVLCTLLKPTAGLARVNGYDVCSQQSEVRDSIGLIFQDQTLDNRLTGWENLRFHAMLYDVPKDRFERRAQELLEMVELADYVHEDVRNYSGGMRRRLEIARGLLHSPKVLFLDEPTIGLDPQTRRHIWDYLLKLRDAEGVTLFMTTHYMDEAENCGRVAVIDHGEIIALDTPERLKAMVGGDVIDLCTSDDVRSAELLRERHDVEPRTGPGGEVIVEAAGGDRLIPPMLATLASAGIEVRSINLKRPTLEDVFIKLTGRRIRAEGADTMTAMRQHAQMWGGGGRR